MDSLKSLRRLQLYILLLNIVNRQLIFTWKIVCIGICIVSGYAGIAHFSEHVVFGIMYYALLFEGSLIYTLMYEKGFKVPTLFGKTRTLLMLRANRNVSRADWKVLKRRLISIPSMGIKVGGFHTLERTSTPVFLNYVLTNVVSMLVALEQK